MQLHKKLFGRHAVHLEILFADQRMLHKVCDLSVLYICKHGQIVSWSCLMTLIQPTYKMGMLCLTLFLERNYNRIEAAY